MSELAAYHISACTEQVEEMMLLDYPPLSLPILLLALASTHLIHQNVRKAWLLVATARAYLQQLLPSYIEALSQKNSSSTPELETYKYAVHFCKTSDDHLTAIMQSPWTPAILNIDPELLLPQRLEGDDPTQHSLIMYTLSWENLKNRANSWICVNQTTTGTIRTINWKIVKEINNEFSTWYRRLPNELKIGDNPFDISAMDLPRDLDVGICALNLQYYGEWMSFYGCFLYANISEPTDDEGTLTECKQIVFLASQAIVKLAQQMAQVEICRIEFYWILFVCEPLLLLVNSSDQHIASESRKALYSSVKILKAVMAYSYSFPSSIGEDNYQIALVSKLIDRIAGLFSSYGIQF
jgi:hypothetical protein